ncbi:MAG: glycerol-3-phosphate acyltransferase, partial [candidate division WOR-3 bacterium]
MFLLVIFPFQNNFLINYFFSLFVGFIFGSIPFGYLIAKLKGIDIRQYGSKNIGFNNVRRVVGLKYAIPVLILDIAKGLLPVVFAAQLEAIPIMVGLGAILGHSFTPWLSFKGGKGVATTIGVILALIPWSLLVGIVVFIIVALL